VVRFFLAIKPALAFNAHMKENKAQRIAKTIANGVNAAVLPASSLQMTVQQILAGWNVTSATAQEIRWILTENWK